MGSARLPLALTMGDPAGIGPEITVKAWQTLRAQPENCFFVVGASHFYHNGKTITRPAEATRIFTDHLPVLEIESPHILPGQPDFGAAKAILKSIELAVGYALDGQASTVVTNPIAKDVLYGVGFSHPGHTEYLAHLAKNRKPPYAPGPVMMLIAKGLRVALVTIHTALARVPEKITGKCVMAVARTLDGALKTDFGISNPRIAMAGLNPHAGEGGALGREEIDILIPAAKALREEGIFITNPQSADTLFHEEARAGYDAVLAMYHDQGLIPVKTLDFHGGVNTTLGLPIVRTSPNQGTAFGIAGKDIARPDSLIAAIKAAREMVEQRAGTTG